MENFKHKIEEQFRIINLKALKEPKHIHHLYADFIELMCLFANEYVSPSDVLDRLYDDGDDIVLDENEPDGEIGLRETEKSDKQESWINVVFAVLEERSKSFNGAYPFFINGTGVKQVEGVITTSQQLYIYLLISSSLKYFPLLQSVLTSEFEVLSGEVLKNYLPSNAVVKQFGKNTQFEGNARDKIRSLARELSVDTNEHFVEQISIQNNQEEGLDLIGWIPFKDNNPNTLILLGQSGCGKKWVAKQHETRRYENFFYFELLPPIHTLFIPYALSTNDGKFFQSKNIIRNTLVFERKRLLEYLQDQDFFNSFQSKEVVRRCIEYAEDIV